jgi:hypothetical protein
MLRPSATAPTIEEKLSSANTMSLASFATAVPVMPMAMPTIGMEKGQYS